MERRIEPDTQVACQALEDAKFCVESEELREMFANLITSTMDSDKSENVHPSFSGILKRLSPLDALFFSKIKPGRTYKITEKPEKNCLKLDYHRYVITEDTDNIPNEKNTVLSFSVLSMQGLIKISNASTEMEKHIENGEYNLMVVDKPGGVGLTTLGRMFYKCCIGDIS